MSGKGKKIMIVDDEYDIVYVLRRHLERWGYSVDAFTNPLHALKVFKENPSRYSVVFTDIRMPEMTGIVLAQLMLKVKPDAKIIILTAYELTAQDLRLSLPEITSDQVLRKPISPVLICDAVKKQLQAA